MWCEARSAQLAGQARQRDGEDRTEHASSDAKDAQARAPATRDITLEQRAAIPPSGQRTLDGPFVGDTLNSKQKA
jgi:hypothetical protein